MKTNNKLINKEYAIHAASVLMTTLAIKLLTGVWQGRQNDLNLLKQVSKVDEP